MPHSRLRPLAYLGGTVLFWGTSFVAIKTAQGSLSPMMVMWLRMVTASIVFLPFWRRIPKSRYRRGDWKFLGGAVLFIPCLYYLLEGYAVHYTTSSQAGVVSAVMPLMVAAGAWALLGERLSWQGAVGIAASIAGIAVLSLSGRAHEAAQAPALGNALELGAMAAAAASTLTVKHLSERYDPWFLTGLQAAVGVVFFAPLAFAHPGALAQVRGATAQAWGSVLYLGTFASLGAFGLYNTALKALPANRVALAINLIPAVAMIAGWFVLGESLTAVQIGACGLIVGAVTFAELSGHVAAEEAAAPAP